MFERQSRERGDFNRGHVANHISLGICSEVCGSACYSEDPRLEATCASAIRYDYFKILDTKHDMYVP